MVRKFSLMLFVVALSLGVIIPAAFADQPDSVGGGLGNKSPNFGESLGHERHDHAAGAQ
jgi:hypothetical protein